MGCTNCNQDADCGCTQESLHISQVCNPIQCEVEECSESFPASCSVYTGADIVCDNVIIVESGTNVAQALANIVAYVCNLQTTAPKKFVFEGTLADADATITIPNASLVACGLVADACGVTTNEISDVVISGFRHDATADIWHEFTHFDKSYVSFSTTGDLNIVPAMVPSPAPEEYPVTYRITVIG
jgi:hypothetical protein